MGSRIEQCAREAAAIYCTGGNLTPVLEALQAAIAAADDDDDAQGYRSAAKRLHQDDGRLEIDHDAIVSLSDNGAYVAAWVWVDRNELPSDSALGAKVT